MQKFLTPAGITGYTALTRPVDGEFSVKMRFEGAAADEMKGLIKKLVANDPREDVKPSGVKLETDENDNPTGALLVTFKCKAEGKRRKDGKAFTRSVTVVDSQNKTVTEDVYKGSEIRIAFATYQTAWQGQNYLKMQPLAAQVLQLSTGGGQAPVSDMFDVVEGGFSTSGETTEAPAAEETPAGGDSWDF